MASMLNVQAPRAIRRAAINIIMPDTDSLLRRNPAGSEAFQGLRVTVRGAGQPVLMIPGLNCAASVWDETCEQLQASGVQCHIMQLPGFAGLPTATRPASQGFLDSMRDRLLAYIDARNLNEPIVMGHSLGGVLALKMAMKAKDRMARLIIVDALPFSPAAYAPDTTVADMRALAEGMRLDMLACSIEAYQRQLKANLAGVTHDVERLEQLMRWSLASDRATCVQAKYEMLVTDLRADLAAITQPTLVLAACSGARAGMAKTFAEQYQNLAQVRILPSEMGRHFLMWDDGPWLMRQILDFIEQATQTQAISARDKSWNNCGNR